MEKLKILKKTERKTNGTCYHFLEFRKQDNKSNSETVIWWLPWTRGWGRWGEVDRKLQTLRDKMS